jgi:hypothetical protein
VFQSHEAGEPDAVIKARLKESFERMRDREVGDTQPTDADEDEVREPSVPAKLFIGPDATWYDDRWRWMEWRRRWRSWNWAAATTFGLWFGYRRMYGWLLAQSLCVLAALALFLIGVPFLVPIALLVASVVLAGIYGNYLYLNRFRRVAGKIARTIDDHESQVEAVERAGGVDRRIVWLWPIVMIAAGIGLVIGLMPDVDV